MHLFSIHQTLPGFLRHSGDRGFTPQNIREIVGLEFNPALNLANKMMEYNMIKHTGGDYKLTRAGAKFLKEMR